MNLNQTAPYNVNKQMREQLTFFRKWQETVETLNSDIVVLRRCAVQCIKSIFINILYGTHHACNI